MKKYILSSLLTGLITFSGTTYASNLECYVSDYDISRVSIVEKKSPNGIHTSYMKIDGSEQPPSCTGGPVWGGCSVNVPSPHSDLIFYVPLDKSKQLHEAVYIAMTSGVKVYLNGYQNDTFWQSLQPSNTRKTGACEVHSIHMKV